MIEVFLEDYYKLDEPNRLYHDIVYYLRGYDKFYIDTQIETVEARKLFQEKKYRTKDTGQTHRGIGHWDKLGYFIPSPNEPREEKARRTFSTGDLLWIRVISKLRDFGMSSDKLKEAAKCVYYVNKATDEPDNYRNNMDAAAYMCKQNWAMFAVVFDDGWLELASWGDIVFSIEKNVAANKNLIVVSLNECMRELFPDGDYKEVKGFGIKDEEKAVIEAMRSDKIREIKITKNDNGKLSINTLRKEKVKKTQTDYLKDITKSIKTMGYGDINIKIEDGHPVLIQSTQNKRL